VEPPAAKLTNRERLEIIRELRKQPPTKGDVMFAIPTTWFKDWKRNCEQQPDNIDPEYPCIDTSSLGWASVAANYKQEFALDRYLDGSISVMMVSHATWSRLSDWYFPSSNNCNIYSSDA